jgi:type I restriction enzyme S subunit
MKPSGIDWIGEIPHDWILSRVKYDYDITLGKMLQPEQENTTDELLDYLCSVNVSWEGIDLTVQKQMWFSAQERRQYQLKKGDLIVAEGGNVAVSCILKTNLSDCYIQNALHRVRGKEGVSNAYLFYWLYTLKHTGYIDLICNKATFAHFTKDKFGEIPICNVPLPEQTSIATFLDEKCGIIDSIIKDMNEQIDIMNQYKKAIITETIIKGLDKNAPMKDSEVEWIGKIPAHWEINRLKYYGLMKYGLGEPPEISESGLAIIRATNIQRGKIFSEEMIYVNPKDILKGKDVMLKTDDILIVRSGAYAGDVAIIPEEWKGALAGYDIIFTPLSINSEFLTYSLLSNYVLFCQLYPVRSRAAQPHLNVQDIGELRIVMPRVKEQIKICHFLDSKCAEIDHLISGKQESIRTMQDYKKSLIYEYTTGKKRVKGETQ